MADTTPPPTKLFSPHLLKLLAIAFGVGLLLFLLVWLNARHDYDFYKADGTGTDTEPSSALPAPLPPDVAGTGNASGLDVSKAPTEPRDTPPPVPPDAAQSAARATPTPAPKPASQTGDSDTPVPLSSPAPRYPQDAMRTGAGGTVRVKVSVAADGSVAQLELVESSGNRQLDRAALEALHRWTFRPAMHNGQPASADVVVPIVFSPGG